MLGDESSEQEGPQPERSEGAFGFPYPNPPNCAYEVSVFSAQRMGSMGTEFRDERNIGMLLSLAWYRKDRREESAHSYLRHSCPQRKGCSVEGHETPEAAAKEAGAFFMVLLS